MTAITANNWNTLNRGNDNHIGFRIQEQINKVRRQYESGSSAVPISTQGDYTKLASQTESSSLSGVSLLLRSALAGGKESTVSAWLDSRDWVNLAGELGIDNPVSVPSLKKTSISEWISYVRNNLPFLENSESMGDRLSLLAYDEEASESVAVDNASLATFVMFLSSNKIERKPSIGLKDSGCIDALWRYSKDQLVEIVFLPGHESQIVTFSPDLLNPNVINRRVATLPIGNIMDVISSRNLNSLFFKSSKAVRAV